MSSAPGRMAANAARTIPSRAGGSAGSSYGAASSGSSYSPRTPRRVPKSQWRRPMTPTHLLTLADLSPSQIHHLLITSLARKTLVKNFGPGLVPQSLRNQTVALLFNKLSTRTRVSTETSVANMGGHPMFLGKNDIQLGVNETPEDTAKVISSMVDGIVARVGDHSEIETLAEHSAVPVVNALSSRYHPMQILADLLTIFESTSPSSIPSIEDLSTAPERDFVPGVYNRIRDECDFMGAFAGKKVAWVGDLNNITNEMLVSMPRLGMELSIAAPAGYDKVEDAVWDRVKEAGSESRVTLTNSPKEALYNADYVVTDTWISMGQEQEKATRMKAFEGYQITNEMVESAGARTNWKFMHCLPRKPEEVDDEVFYGPRSLVFPEAENRKWTAMATYIGAFSQWRFADVTPARQPRSNDGGGRSFEE